MQKKKAMQKNLLIIMAIFLEIQKKILKPVILPQYGDVYNSGLIDVKMDEVTNKLKVKIPPLRALTGKPKRIASGHGACPGCGIFAGLELFFKGIEGDIVTLSKQAVPM